MSILYEFNLPSEVHGLPAFDSSSDLNNIPNLGDYDIDENLPQSIQSKYFTVSELSSLETNLKDLSIFHTNIRSLSRHLDELTSLLSSLGKQFDVIGVSEMWHSESNPILTNMNIDGYQLFDTKSLSQNGGVGLFVKSSLCSNKRDDLNCQCEEFETIWIEIDVKNDKNLLFCCVYRHPNSTIDKLTSHFVNILSKTMNKQVFIMGDFNINLLNYDSHAPTSDFINNFFNNHFLPSINHPTRISDNSSTIIDNIFTNMIDSQIICGNILTQISDHFPQFLILRNSNISYTHSDTFKYDYSAFNETNFIRDFDDIDKTYINEVSDANANYDKFLNDVTTLVSNHVPIKKFSKREVKFKTKPWINPGIQKMMKIRDQMLRKFKRTKSRNTLTVYKKFRNRVANELKKSRINYFQNYFTENSQNMKKLWSGIKSIISNKSSVSSRINKIKTKSGNLTSDPAEISNEFNQFFVNVANNITETIPKTPKSPIDYLINRNSSSFFLSPVTPIEVNEVILHLDPSKSIGPGSIPIKLLKILGPKISQPLAELVNQSFLEGTFPLKLRMAKVISLYKKGDPILPSNYRPISLLPIFSKVYEKLMHKRLYSFLKDHKIIYPLQFGFQENHSIDHALISMTEEIRSTLDNKKFGCGIFIDLQKAFDTVNHEILLAKLEHYGIRDKALNWFRSYLSGRKQYVTINGYDSNVMEITCGVPQGSVLGPLLFLIFINDLPSVSRKLKFYLFADDTNIYFDCDSIFNLAKKVNKELKFVKKWLDANKLSLNISKTNYVIFHSSNTTIPQDIVIKIGKKHIIRANYVKFLGLLLDENLSWKYHLSELSKKLARTCGIFFKIRSLLPTHTLINVYNSLFVSFLQYGITVWGQTFDSYLDPIFKLQKKAVRAISHEHFTSHTLPIFKNLKLLRLQDIFRVKILSFVYESLNKINPSCFHDFFSLNSRIHQHFTRQSHHGHAFLTQKNSLQYGLRSIRYLGAKMWNDLPGEIRNSASKFSFKRNLKKFILVSL